MSSEKVRLRVFFYDDTGRSIGVIVVNVPSWWDWPQIIPSLLRRRPDLSNYSGVVGEVA